MNTSLGYSKRTLDNTKVLLSGGGDKLLSDFIGSISWDAQTRKIKYTPVGGTATDLVTFGSNAFTNDSNTYIRELDYYKYDSAENKAYRNYSGADTVDYLKNLSMFAYDKARDEVIGGRAYPNGLGIYLMRTYPDAGSTAGVPKYSGGLYLASSGNTAILFGYSNNNWFCNTIYHSGNLPAYPTKASWNYDDMYVKSVSISGNNLRINKNGTNTDLTIPYATNADTLDGYHAASFSFGHINDWSFTTVHNSNYVTFDKQGASGAPNGHWFNGFVSTHANYLSSYIVNDHRTNDWYLGYSNNGSTPEWKTIIHSGNIGSQSVNYAASAGSVAWGNVTSKPFNWSGQSGQPTWLWGSNDGSNYYVWNPSNFSVNYANSAGYAGYSGKVSGSYTANGGQQNPNYFGTNRVGFLMMNTTVNGNSHYKDWIIMDCYGGNDVGGGVAIGVNRQALGAYIMRSAAARSSWAESAELIGTHNYTTYCATSGHNHDGRYLYWAGSAANATAMGWGTLTAANGYTILSHASSSDGGDWGMVNKGGQIFMQLDGYYYQNEGRYRCIDTSEVSGLSVNYASSAGNADTVDSLHASNFGRIYNSGDIGSNYSVTVNDMAGSGGSNATFGMVYGATDNPTGTSSWVHVWSQQWSINVSSSWVSQIAIGAQAKNGMWYRTTDSAGGIAGLAWKRVLDSSNYNSYALPLSGGTLSGNLTISHAASATMTAASTNPKITFAESGSLPVHLTYTDYDSYRSPAGLKVVGGTDATPAWFEAEGNMYATNYYTTSDRSKKQNISSLSEHIRKFQLKDTEKWHYGVIAQEVPEMFRDGKEGNMTVNYTSILSYYVGLLENRVKELENKIKLLEDGKNS